MRFLKKNDQYRFTVKVTPKASKNACLGWKNDQLIIKLHAAPEKNQANLELIKFLSKLLNTPKSCISITSGKASRIKKILIISESINNELFKD